VVIQCELDLLAVRTLYDAVCDAIENWPGSPARPAHQQEDYLQMKQFLFALLCEASLEVDKN
jgi:hypothetical protein